MIDTIGWDKDLYIGEKTEMLVLSYIKKIP